MERVLDLSPETVADRLAEAGGRASWIRVDGRLEASDPSLGEVTAFLEEGVGGARGHEAVFLALAPSSGALLGAFIHATARGQAQGGLRRAPYPDLQSFLADGLRLSWGMSRKSALAGLWWGGGKGLIAWPLDWPEPEDGARRTLYREYGDFVSSLDGCYVTAEDAGTRPEDVASVFTRTRFVTCIPPELGGAGNPAPATACGVVRGIEAALDAMGRPELAGRRIATQGLGNVGTAVVDELLARGVAGIVASDISAERCGELSHRWRDAPVEVRLTSAGDPSVLFEPCDVLVPNALGAVLGPATIPRLQTALVCGAANNPLEREERDGAALQARGIVYVPDFVVNRMGIVQVANEQSGRLACDPEIERHLDPTHPQSIPAVVTRILDRAREDGVTPVEAANQMAERLAREPHPLFGFRTREILQALHRKDWARDPAAAEH